VAVNTSFRTKNTVKICVITISWTRTLPAIIAVRFAEGKNKMTIDLAWIDFYLKDRLFGFGFLSITNELKFKSLFAVYWNDRQLLVDLFWIRVIKHRILWGYKN